MFSQDIEENCETLRELLRGLPPSQRNKAARAAGKIEKAFTNLQKDHPKDAAVALGAAFAIYMIGARIVEQAKESDGKGLIQLLS
jgi:hypothetical protein